MAPLIMQHTNGTITRVLRCRTFQQGYSLHRDLICILPTASTNHIHHSPWPMSYCPARFHSILLGHRPLTVPCSRERAAKVPASQMDFLVRLSLDPQFVAPNEGDDHPHCFGSRWEKLLPQMLMLMILLILMRPLVDKKKLDSAATMCVSDTYSWQSMLLVSLQRRQRQP